VVAVEEKVLAEEHPDRLESHHGLARVYRAGGQVGMAVELLKHVVAVKAMVLRDGHPSQLDRRMHSQPCIRNQSNYRNII
jgi:hypothetical protein